MRTMSFRSRWKMSEYVRNSLWIVPGLFAVLAIAVGIYTPIVDEGTTVSIGLEFSAGAAQAILGAIAGGMITFTGFVFSILLLAVQFGSSQFSPRLLRRFLRDPTTKISLGVFIATFLYALMVLRTIGVASNPDFVPDDSITVSLLLLIASMVMFLRLISRTTQGLRVAAVVRILGGEGADVIRRSHPDSGRGPGRDRPRLLAVASEPSSAEPAKVVEFREEAGVLQSVDAKGLIAIGREADVVVELVPAVGDLVAPGMSLFRVHGAGTVDDDRLRQSVAVGDERAMRQDPAFVLRLLADISSKALSPGVNDPTTAVQALDQIDLLLRLLASRRLTPGEWCDEAGQVRFCYPARTWDDFLSLALDEARAFGETSAQITRRLRALLQDLHATAPPYRRPAIEAQLALLEASVGRAHTDPAERRIAATHDRQGLGTSHPDVEQESSRSLTWLRAVHRAVLSVLFACEVTLECASHIPVVLRRCDVLDVASQPQESGGDRRIALPVDQDLSHDRVDEVSERGQTPEGPGCIVGSSPAEGAKPSPREVREGDRQLLDALHGGVRIVHRWGESHVDEYLDAVADILAWVANGGDPKASPAFTVKDARGRLEPPIRPTVSPSATACPLPTSIVIHPSWPAASRARLLMSTSTT